MWVVSNLHATNIDYISDYMGEKIYLCTCLIIDVSLVLVPPVHLFKERAVGKRLVHLTPDQEVAYSNLKGA